MNFLIKNRFLLTMLFFIGSLLIVPSIVLAADPVGCCRWDNVPTTAISRLISVPIRYAEKMTKSACKTKDNPYMGIDMINFWEDAYPSKGMLGSGKNLYQWCKYNDSSKNIPGCCQWHLIDGDSDQAWSMSEIACESMKGNGISDVSFFKNGVVKDDRCDNAPATPNPGGGSGSSGGGGYTGPVSTFSSGWYNLTNPLGTNSVPTVVGKVIKALLGIIGSIALAMFVAGGLMWMTSAGNDKQLGLAKATLIWATAGMIVIFFSYIFVKFVLESIGV